MGNKPNLCAKGSQEKDQTKGFFLVREEEGQPIITGWCLIEKYAENGQISWSLPDHLDIYSGDRFLFSCQPDQGRPDVMAAFESKCPANSGFVASLPAGADWDSINVEAVWGDKKAKLAPQFEDQGAKNFIDSIDRKTLDNLRVPRLNFVTFGLTEACNLRCVYCTTRAMERQGTHNTDPDIRLKWEDDFIEKMKGLTCHVFFCGNGEPTLRKDWVNIVDRLTKIGIQVLITSNLSRPYTDKEIEAFAHLHTLGISVDTPNDELHAKTRVNSQLAVIKENIRRIRKYARDHGLSPRLIFSTVCHNYSIPTLPQLAHLAVELGIDEVSLMGFGKGSALQQCDIELYGIGEFSPNELEIAKNSLEEFDKIMGKNRKKYSITADLLSLKNSSTINDHIACTNSDIHQAGVITTKVNADMTRDCLGAWGELNFFQGFISPCCVIRTQIPYSNNTDFSKVINHPAFLRIRHGLYTGKLMETCARCHLKPLIPVSEFQEKVKKFRKSH